MVYIFAAHKGEVEHLIKKLSLGKRKTSFPFLQYEGEEILLTITGQGQINASASVASTLQEEKAKKGDLLLSLGSAAAILGRKRTSEDLLGRWFWIHSLEQESTGRKFYPDLLYKPDFPEAGLITGDKILELDSMGNRDTVSERRGDSKEQIISERRGDSKGHSVSERHGDSKEHSDSEGVSGLDNTLLYDMESAAVFQTANFYLAPEDFFFLRCVTDFGVSPDEEKRSFSPLSRQERMQALLQKEEDKVLRFIGFLQEKSKERRKEEEGELAFRQQLQSLSKSLHCSFVMEKQLERLLRYAFLQGISAEEVREYLEQNFGRRNAGNDALQDSENGAKEEVLKGVGNDIDKQGRLTLIDKRAGKKALSSLKEWILSERILQVKCNGSGNLLQIHDNDSEVISPIPCERSGSTLPEGKCEKSYPYQEHFQHIYVEESLLQSPETKGILQKFPKAKVIPIKHYKDVFNRKKQGRLAQSHSRKLILAKKEGQRLYDGAVVCQDFSESHFCYTSLLMNCPFHCAYCYLQGMYPSSNLVMFLNLEDYFADCRKWIAEKGSLYLCISYDTDLLAMEGIYPYVEEFARFLNQENALRIEVRTKAGGEGLWRKMQRLPLSSEGRKRMIFAFTLSPEEIIEEAEEGTARLSSRIIAIQKALEEGYLVRLCFDPMIYHPRWKELYGALLQEVFEKIPMEQIHDCSLGSFRISESYLKAMGKALPHSPHTQFPYENTGGYYHYPKELMEEMEGFLYSRLLARLPKEKIFRWDNREADGVNEK